MIFFFFNDTATTEIYTLSLHDALPIFTAGGRAMGQSTEVYVGIDFAKARNAIAIADRERGGRSEEHTSELQSRQYLVCRLLLEKKKNHFNMFTHVIDIRSRHQSHCVHY